MNRLVRGCALAIALVMGGFAAHAEPFAYLSDTLGRQVVVIDTALRQVVANIPIDGAPTAVAIPPVGWLGYVVTDGNALTVLDTSGQRALGKVPVGSDVEAIAYNPANGHLYLKPPYLPFCRGPLPCPAGGVPNMWVQVMEASTFSLLAKVDLPGPPCSMELDPVNPRAYLRGCDSSAVWVTDDVNYRMLATFNTTATLGGQISRSAADGRLYLNDSVNNRVVIVDPEGGASVGTIPAGTTPGAIVMNPSGTRAFVRNAGSNDVSVIDVPRAQVIATILPGVGAAGGMDITPDGQWLYVARPGAGRVTVVSVDTLNTVAEIGVPVGTNAPGHFIGGLSQPPSQAPGPLTGLWWNPAEPGWGMHLAQRSNTVFAAWFTYDPAGAAKWYIASNCQIQPPLACPTCVTNAFCTGNLYEATGPAFFTGPFNAAAVNLTQVGALQMTFQGPDNATITWSVKGNVHNTAIQRQVFRTGASPATDYTDLWFNAFESGWGLGVVQQADLMFVTWYVYDDGGAPVWYFASNCAVSAAGNGCSGKLYRTAGPAGPASGQAFDPSKVRVTEVGQIDVSFTDANNGMISYSVNGRTGTRSITRQVF